MYIGLSRTQSDFDSALALAEKSFDSNGSRGQGLVSTKATFLLNHPGLHTQAIVIKPSLEGDVIASAFLVKSYMLLGKDFHTVFFLSSISVGSDHRGYGYSSLLMKKSIEVAKELNGDLAVVIARKAVDGFYLKFGFYGIARYSKLVVATQGYPFHGVSDVDYMFEALNTQHLEACSALYAESYSKCSGSSARDNKVWRYILNKIPLMGLTSTVIIRSGYIIGYLVYTLNGLIVEFATSEDDMASLLNGISNALFAGSKSHLEFQISNLHTEFLKFKGLDVTYSVRDCPYGGHMVKTLRPLKGVFGLGNLKCDNRRGDAESFEIDKDLSKDIFLSVSYGKEFLFDIPLLDQI